MRAFGVGALRICRALPDDVASRHVARQLVRAATGGGANYEEARGAESRADFIHKLSIANKEMRESMYWLHLVHASDLIADSGAIPVLIREADALVSILTASIRTAKGRESTNRED